MNCKFVALPVGQGDAFFYKDQNTAVLVDGGRSVHGFAAQFRHVLSCSELDVLICTHNDADHANGVIGLLESGIRCREVWLPGRWTERLADLLSDPQSVSFELVEDWHKDRDNLEGVATLDDYGDYLSSSDARAEELGGNTEASDDASDNLTSALENASPESDSLAPALHPFEFGLLPLFSIDSKGAEIVFDAVVAASRIRRIALAAFHSGATIRWFEYGYVQSVPGSTITPLNCHEIVHIRRSTESVLKYLALSKANRESLVFSVPPTHDSPGVVFSADSDFGFACNLDDDANYLVTAPHHGSESNANAYIKLSSILENGIIVRSDGNYRSRPGKSFLSVKSNQRFCTLCRGSNEPKQLLAFKGDSSGWHAAETVRVCTCR